jgi:hypothetical protein
MPVLDPPVSSSVVSTPATGGAGGITPPPAPGSKIPLLADSAVVYEYSYSTGTGPYTLAGAVGSWKAVADAYDDGATVVYRATDKSARTEYVIGTFDAASGTLSRDTILGSTAGGFTPINWTGRTRVLIHTLVQGLSLCDTPPTDKQLLSFDAASGEWCPITLVFPTPEPDDDTADMQDVTSGTSYNVTLTKPVTQIVWLSSDSGDKITSIPQCETSINGYSLDVKTTLANSDNHFIVPLAGTVAGLANLMFTDENCNAFLRCDAKRNDWVLRCLCCSTPMSGTPSGGGPPVSVTVPCACLLHPTKWSNCSEGSQFAGGISPDGLGVEDSFSNPGTIYTCGESYLSGKYYFEFQYLPTRIPLTQLWAAGIVNSSRVIPGGIRYIGDDSLSVSVGCFRSWGAMANQPWPSTTPTLIIAEPNIGDWVGFAVDLDGLKLWVRNATAGGAYNPLLGGTQDPATGAGGFPIPATVVDGVNPVLIGWSAAANAFSQSVACRLNVGVTAFAGSVPSGYLAWDPHP